MKQAFTPEDQAYQNDRDLDMSTGAMLLPDAPLARACNTEGKCYVVDRFTIRVVQEFQTVLNTYGGDRMPNIRATPVIWKNAGKVLEMYVWAEEDYLRVFHFDDWRLRAGGTSTVRAMVPTSGDANAGMLAGKVRAFDESNIAKEFWNSEEMPDRDRLGMFARFFPPVVAGGRVYVVTFAE